MASYFKINFAETGKNITRVDPHKERIQRILQKKVGISTFFLIVFYALLIFGGVSYITNIYLPMEKTLKDAKGKLTKMEVAYNMNTGFHQEEVVKARNALKIIDEINETKKKAFHWSERLRALERTLVKNLWLSSLEIKEIRSSVKQDDKSGKDKKKKKEITKFMGYKLTIRGATYTDPTKKPLKKISRFMSNLIDEPYWGDYFKLKDWTINSTEKETQFEVVLESKSL